jgi:hypothetical protein
MENCLHEVTACIAPPLTGRVSSTGLSRLSSVFSSIFHHSLCEGLRANQQSSKSKRLKNSDDTLVSH